MNKAIEDNDFLKILRSVNDIIKCPNCGESYYTELYHTATAIYSPTVIKDGKVVSKDPNFYTTHCRCLACGKDFTITKHYDEVKVEMVKDKMEDKNT